MNEITPVSERNAVIGEISHNKAENNKAMI